MASQNPSQRSSIPKPLDTPRTNPLETSCRKSGELSSKGLSVHRGVQGRINRRTPQVAHTVTNNSAWIRNSQICPPETGPRPCSSAVSWRIGSCAKFGSASCRVGPTGTVFRSAVRLSSPVTARECSRIELRPSRYFTSSGP